MLSEAAFLSCVNSRLMRNSQVSPAGLTVIGQKLHTRSGPTSLQNFADFSAAFFCFLEIKYVGSTFFYAKSFDAYEKKCNFAV